MPKSATTETNPVSDSDDRKPNRSPKLRLLALLLIIIALAFVGWLRIPGYYANQAAQAIFLHDIQTAKHKIVNGKRWSPSHPELLFLDARCSRILGQFDEMDVALEDAAAHGLPPLRVTGERLLAAAQSGQIDATQEQLLARLSADVDVSATCDAYAQGCLMKYRLQEAENILEIWKKDVPTDPQPYFLAGRLAEHNADTANAIEQLQQAVQLSPRHAPAAYNLARVLVSLQRYDEAEAAYQQAAAAIWQPLPARLGVAHCRLEKGDFDSAASILESVDSVDIDAILEVSRYLGDPSYLTLSRLPSLKGRLYASEENYDKAVSAFRQALDVNPHDWRTRYQFALALKKAGYDEQAKQELASVDESRSALEKCDEYITRVRKNPADVEARFLIGKAMLEHVSEYQGIVWLTSVLEYDEDHKEAIELLSQHADTASQYFQNDFGNQRPQIP